MLRMTKELLGYDIQALDGNIGKVEDFYFEDSDWKTRYLVVDTGLWILGRKVLVVPSVLGEPDWIGKVFPVNLTREQIKNSPDIATDKPISKQELVQLHEYYGWPKFWVPLPATTAMPKSVGQDTVQVEPEAAQTDVVEAVAQKQQQEPEFALRSAKEVIGYDVIGEDEKLGVIDDFILDDKAWAIRYLVLDTGDLIGGKKVLLGSRWTRWIRHTKTQVLLDLDKDAIKSCPAFDPGAPINRRQEEVLYDFFGRPYYWKEQ